jgi:hypothetical protein
MTEQRLKTATLNLRIEPRLKKAAEQAAADDRRSMTSLVEKLLQEHLEAKGYLSANATSTARRSQAVTARKAAGAAIDRVQNRDSDTPEDVKAYRKKKLMKIPSKLTKRSS